jgi:hypothetical protein
MCSIHPTNESIVLTPDNGCIECKHEAAAKRVAAELNERIQEIARLRAIADQQGAMLCLYKGSITRIEDAFEESAAAAHSRL